MSRVPEPPKTYKTFVRRYPELGRAWELIGEAGRTGPLDERTARLVKLGIAIGALRQGAVSSSVRKALGKDISLEELEQVVALAAGTIGMPAAVAAFSWIHEAGEKSNLLK